MPFPGLARQYPLNFLSPPQRIYRKQGWLFSRDPFIGLDSKHVSLGKTWLVVSIVALATFILNFSNYKFPAKLTPIIFLFLKFENLI
jgi:hypothetical protein